MKTINLLAAGSVLWLAGAAAILTPPDVVTQIMMALPLMLLYEISIVGARIFGKKKEVPASAAEAESTSD